MTEYSGAEPSGRGRSEGDSEVEYGGPVDESRADPRFMAERSIDDRKRARPEPRSSLFVAIMAAVGVLGIAASTTGLIVAAATTSEPFWRWTTAIYFVSLALAIWALGMGASQVIQRREFIGIAQAAGWSFAEDTRLSGVVSDDELGRVQRLRSQLYAIGAHRAGEDLTNRVALVIEDQQQVIGIQATKAYRITEEP